MQGLGQSLEFMDAAVLETQARVCHQMAHSAEHHRFSCLRFDCDKSRDVHGDASDIIALQLDLAGMQPAPNRNRIAGAGEGRGRLRSTERAYF